MSVPGSAESGSASSTVQRHVRFSDEAPLAQALASDLAACDTPEPGKSQDMPACDAGGVAGISAQERLHARLDGVPLDKFSQTEQIAWYCAHDFEPPPRFQHVWHFLGDQQRTRHLSADEHRLLTRVGVVLLVCDIHDKQQMETAKKFASRVNTLQSRAPMMIIVPHSQQQRDGRQEARSDSDVHIVSHAKAAGIHGFIVGEPAGFNLAVQVSTRITQIGRLKGFVVAELNRRRRSVEYADLLRDVMHDTVWNYLRVRLGTNLPTQDDNLGQGQPEAVGGLLVGTALGRGQIAKVCRLTNPMKPQTSSGQVVKIMDKSRRTSFKSIVNIGRQLKAMEALNELPHPNVVRFHEVYHADSCLLFRMEDGGPSDLHKRLALRAQNLRPLDAKLVKDIVHGVVAGVCHMHTQAKVVHANINPGNIVLVERRGSVVAKLTDFDCANVAESSTRHRGPVAGVPFAAPESFLNEWYDPVPADIWSMAVVILEVLCGLGVLGKALELQDCSKNPNRADGLKMEKRHMKQIRSFFKVLGNSDMLVAKHILPELQDLSVPASCLLSGMLNVSVEERWAAHDVATQVAEQLA